FFHKSHAKPLSDAAFDLTFDESGVDSAADVVGGGELQNLDGAKLEVDLDFGEMSAETVDSVGNALAIFVQRFCRGIIGHFSAKDVAALVERQLAQIDFRAGRFFAEVQVAGLDVDWHGVRQVTKFENFLPQFF